MSLSSLKKFIKLSSSVKFYVPSTVFNKVIDNKKHVKEVATLFSKLFGGATVTDAFGYWIDKNGELIPEPTKIVYSFCTGEDLKNGIEEVVKKAKNLKKELEQEAISLEVNGELYFI